MEVESAYVPGPGGPYAGQLMVHVKTGLINTGRVKAGNVGLLVMPIGELQIAHMMYRNENASTRPALGRGRVVYELNHPLYPGSETELRLPTVLTPQAVVENRPPRLESLGIVWKVFADSANPKSGELRLNGPDSAERVWGAWQRHLRASSKH